MEKHSTLSGSHAMSSYARFGIMIVLSFVAMYALMYAMVNTLSNAIPNYTGAFLLVSVLHYCSGKVLQTSSGVDSPS